MFGAMSPTRRLVARGIDEALVLAIQVAFVVPAVALRQVSDDPSPEGIDAITVAGGTLIVTGWFVSVCYEVASTHLGGGPGKRALRLQVVAADACAVLPGGASILRWALVTGVQPLLWGIVAVVAADTTAVRLLGVVLVVVSVLWRGVLALSTRRGDGSRGFHDRLVGSRVVPARVDDGGTGSLEPDEEGAPVEPVPG